MHRGALVSLGYWNDPDKTAERFKPAPGQPSGLVMPEIAVWSGDTVRTDEEGFLYFIGRRDEMIKTSGYRVSPTEVEEVVYAHRAGRRSRRLRHRAPGARAGDRRGGDCRRRIPSSTRRRLLAKCRERLPAFMVPARIIERKGSLPRNPNGKIDRKLLAQEFAGLFEARRMKKSARPVHAPMDQFPVVDDCLVVGGDRAARACAPRRPHAVLRLRPATHQRARASCCAATSRGGSTCTTR